MTITIKQTTTIAGRTFVAGSTHAVNYSTWFKLVNAGALVETPTEIEPQALPVADEPAPTIETKPTARSRRRK